MWGLFRVNVPYSYHCRAPTVQAMTPTCPALLSSGYTCDRALPLADDSDPTLEAGQTLAHFCPLTCGTCTA